jgi:hypothetical protein
LCCAWKLKVLQAPQPLSPLKASYRLAALDDPPAHDRYVAMRVPPHNRSGHAQRRRVCRLAWKI